jgi:hypothetical protein
MPFKIIDDVEAHSREDEIPFVHINNGDFNGVELPEEWDVEPDPEDSFDAEVFQKHTGALVSVTPSQFTEFAIMLPDKESQTFKPFSFDQRRYLKQIYDTPNKRTLLKCGRQVEKSTMLGNKLLSYSCINTALNSLYVSPTNQQTKVFSQDRLKEPIETSNYLKSWTTTKLSDNVFLKKFINRSQITLRYAYLNADRVRGIPADVICLDELQDLLTDNIPVIEECASHSHLKIFMYSGTPKSLDNTIEYYWTTYSTQNEWVVPCHRHTIQTKNGMSRAYWNILSEDHIGETSLVCDRCRKPIYAMDPEAQWVALNPDIIKHIAKPYEGFRIPQLMVPWISHEEILQKQKTYSRPKFYNEVLGLSYDSGTRPLTRQDVLDNCDPRLSLDPEYQTYLLNYVGQAFPVYAGIDWGTGENTYTVLSLGSYMGDSKFTIFYIHRFEGRETEPLVQMDEISGLIEKFRIVLVGCDYGGGFYPNDELTRRFGWQRIIKYQYSQPAVKVDWNEGFHRFMVHRTEVMSDVFNAIKRRTVFRFPNWDQFQNPYAADMLNIFSEYSEQLRQNVYKKSPNCTDDAFHSILYCFLASMIRNPRPDVIAPNANVGTNNKTYKKDPSAHS